MLAKYYLFSALLCIDSSCDVTNVSFRGGPLWHKLALSKIILSSKTIAICFWFPHRWFKFEKVVEALLSMGTYYMDLDELLGYTAKVCQISDKQEFTTMLNFYHDLGVIVKHGRTVVLQAQWLIDLFKQLITVPPFEKLVSN